ncbi:DUF2637 domain-containing protein [Nocardiopsis sp. NPDC055879]
MMHGNLVAWLAFTTGAVVSVGANVLHALDGGGAVDFGRVVAAGWAPVALLLVAELVARARQSGPWWIIALRWAGTAVVAGVAAIVSYGHMRDLLLSYGETALVAHLLPLSVDGLLLVASLALAFPGDTGDRPERPVERVEEAPTVEEERHGLPSLAAPVSVSAVDGTRDTVTVPVGDAQDPGGEPFDDRVRARNAYRVARTEGVPPTGKELAARFGRSESWGRARIRECQAA